jgi:hypothetical protein
MITDRYRQELTGAYTLLEKQQRRDTPRAWKLSEDLTRTMDRLPLDHPAFDALTSLQLQMLRACDSGKDVSLLTERMISKAIDLACPALVHNQERDGR